MRNGALMSARFWHASEQKSNSLVVDFQQSIHDLQNAEFAAVSEGSDLLLTRSAFRVVTYQQVLLCHDTSFHTADMSSRR
jgi:hypothetical protein